MAGTALVIAGFDGGVDVVAALEFPAAVTSALWV
jgi:hypothetical protein